MNSLSNTAQSNLSKWFTLRSTIIGGLSGLLFSLAQKHFSGEPVLAPFIVTMVCLVLSLNETVWSKLVSKKTMRANSAPPAPKARVFTSFSSIDKLVGAASAAATEQAGSRFLQKALIDRDPAFNLIFPELLNRLGDVATDQFGNYLVQSMLEHSNEQQRQALLQRLCANITKFACCQYGVRCIQTLIDRSAADPVATQTILDSLRGNITELSRDNFGNHVVQRTLKTFRFDQCTFMVPELQSDLISTARNAYGCCVLQLVLERCSSKQLSTFSAIMLPHTIRLAQCPYGNYVLQNIIGLGHKEITVTIVGAIKGRVADLSAHKFSSNVIEKIITSAPKDVRSAVIDELIASPKLATLMTDPFGNYVIQKSMNIVDGEQLDRMMDAIRPSVDQLRTAQYGRRIYNRFYKHERLSSEGAR